MMYLIQLSKEMSKFRAPPLWLDDQTVLWRTGFIGVSFVTAHVRRLEFSEEAPMGLQSSPGSARLSATPKKLADTINISKIRWSWALTVAFLEFWE